MPSSFSVQARLRAPRCTVDMAVVVEPNGEILVKNCHVAVAYPGTDAITTTSLRSILITQLIREAIEQLAQPIELLPEVNRGAYQIVGEINSEDGERRE